MGYSDQILTIKNSLNRFETEEKKLSDLYKTAIENAKNANKNALKQLDKAYYDSRNEAYADSARNERNLNNQLAARGLGFSGEAAQAKLNANLSLSDRLSDIAKEKSEAETDYNLKLADTISRLSMEEGDKLRDLLNSKTDFNLKIADMELEKETADADREADKQLNDARIKAEKEMASAELKAKYEHSDSHDSSDHSGTDDTKGYVPDLKAQDLAKQVTGGEHISDEKGKYAVNKFLLGLKNNYKVDPEYYEQLIFMLTAYGYEPVTEPEMRMQVITHEARAYNSDKEFDRLYNLYVANGSTPVEAKMKTKDAIKKNQMDYVYKNTNNNTEFRICCIDLGIGSALYNQYLATKNY